MRSVRFTREAEQELEDAILASPAPDAFRAAVTAALDDIAGGVVQYPIYPGTRCRQRAIPGLPYSLVYLEVTDQVRVLAFPHHRRKPGYWKRRLRPT